MAMPEKGLFVDEGGPWERAAPRRKPAWTVLYNIVTPGSPWIGTAWEFFDDEALAMRRYEELSKNGAYPTKRPYCSADRPHLAAIHELNGEG